MAGVGRGEFRPMLDGHRDDEIGRVTRDFQSMLAELEAARASLEAEQDAHRRSTRALQDADRLVTLGQLSAGLAHEIGSPLQVLHGRARRLLRYADDAEEVRRGAEVIAGQAERITGIVQQLLDVARRRSAHARGDPRASVRSVVELLEFEARRKRVSLQLVVSGDVDDVEVESDVLQQVALNLTRNALQATTEGGRVVLRLGRGTIARAALPAPVESVRLVVEDDGVGIDPRIRSQLFEPFFTTRAFDGGTGLGLAIVGTLVKELDGAVSVTSELGQGTRFVVDIPFASVRHPSKDVGVA
jgi:signal transduction histidine kinase